MSWRPLALAIVAAPYALALGLFAIRVAVSAYYGGGAQSFDEQYEAQIARQVEAVSTRHEAFAYLAAHWQPEPSWRREILHSDGAPPDLCTAAVDQTPDGRGLLMVACGVIDGFRPVGFATQQRYLAELMHDRALWAVERVLRMSGTRYREIGVVAVHQTQALGTDEEAVYYVVLELPETPPELEALLSNLDSRLRIVENSAAGRSAAISSR